MAAMFLILFFFTSGYHEGHYKHYKKPHHKEKNCEANNSFNSNRWIIAYDKIHTAIINNECRENA